MAQDVFRDIVRLTDQEIEAVSHVRHASRLSQLAHLMGEELKECDMVAAEVANSGPYRSALDKIHQASGIQKWSGTED